ncbi:NitT/TauT family transport system permease protein [Tamaricihabitans halophyticus]|uniref:NitT/TauT family transport system permease protein n=1 Tax=Tamaricihabitans halophyticus TaxID=1262583 RepID=A0A4R2QYN9_9PSEU|nr:ABC transporter permease [Tamaricihabitans halophyticus]TCP55323.1 NitT/TauT family transport system permease protein [Tamaricihabitans halophyticus]
MESTVAAPVKTESPHTPTPVPGRRRKRPSTGLLSAVCTFGLLVLGCLFWHLGSALAWWSPATIPPLTEVTPALVEILGSGEFWGDAGRTGFEIAIAFVGGGAFGLLVGIGFWKAPTIGRVFEPYLVSFYAVPLVLFYPVMIVIVGINQWSVIILASIMAGIPMALNTWVGLSGLPPVYLKLARSLGCNPRQTMFEVALPAAAPFIVAGLRLAVVYALIGAVAMEFVTASAGLGFRIRYLYESFDTVEMFVYVLVVLAMSLALTFLLSVAERALLRGRAGR